MLTSKRMLEGSVTHEEFVAYVFFKIAASRSRFTNLERISRSYLSFSIRASSLL